MPATKTKKLLVERDAPVLRQEALPVPLKEIGSKKIGDIISRMKKALHAEDDGVAIAAPQIGEGVRIFVVSGAALAMARKKNVPADQELKDLVFINPQITNFSKKKRKMEEGCLSVRWLYGQVSRHEKVTLKAYDEEGKLVTMGGSGLLAQIFQHETDHLNGILFIDKAENVRDLPPEETLQA
jgi:peptide deformylase